MDAVLEVVALVGGTICSSEDASAVFLLALVLALESGTIHPHLQARTTLHVLQPLAIETGTIGIREFAMSTSMVIAPLSLVGRAVGSKQRSTATGLSCYKLTFAAASRCKRLWKERWNSLAQKLCEQETTRSWGNKLRNNTW